MLHRVQELVKTCTCIKIKLAFRLFRGLVFVEGRKPGEKPLEQGQEPTANSTHIVGIKSLYTSLGPIRPELILVSVA